MRLFKTKRDSKQDSYDRWRNSRFSNSVTPLAGIEKQVFSKMCSLHFIHTFSAISSLLFIYLILMITLIELFYWYEYGAYLSWNEISKVQEIITKPILWMILTVSLMLFFWRLYHHIPRRYTTLKFSEEELQKITFRASDSGKPIYIDNLLFSTVHSTILRTPARSLLLEKVKENLFPHLTKLRVSIVSNFFKCLVRDWPLGLIVLVCVIFNAIVLSDTNSIKIPMPSIGKDEVTSETPSSLQTVLPSDSKGNGKSNNITFDIDIGGSSLRPQLPSMAPGGVAPNAQSGGAHDSGSFDDSDIRPTITKPNFAHTSTNQISGNNGALNNNVVNPDQDWSSVRSTDGTRSGGAVLPEDYFHYFQ